MNFLVPHLRRDLVYRGLVPSNLGDENVSFLPVSSTGYPNGDSEMARLCLGFCCEALESTSSKALFYINDYKVWGCACAGGNEWGFLGGEIILFFVLQNGGIISIVLAECHLG